MRRNNRGNILFLILLAIVLFVALSYVIMNQREQVGSGMSKEAADAAAGNILSWFSTVDVAVQRLMVVKGYAYYQIDFYDPNNYNYDGSHRYVDNSDCNVPDCAVFDKNGGGVPSNDFRSYAPPTAVAAQPYHVAPGAREYVAKAIQDVGTPLPDAVIELALVKREICVAVNRKVGLADCPSTSGSGAFAHYESRATIDASTSALTGDIKSQTTYCICGTNNGNLTGTIGHVALVR